MANEITNTTAKKMVSFSEWINQPTQTLAIRNALNDPNRANRFVTAVVSAVTGNPQLQKCERGSVLTAALQGEALELSPSPSMGEYAIIPYGVNYDREKGDYAYYVANFQIMTQGRLQLAMRSGLYADLDAIEIKEGEYKGRDSLTGKPIIVFTEDDEIRDMLPTIGYYSYYKLLNGFFKSEYWSKGKVIEHAKRYSKAFDIDVYNKVMNGEKITDWKEKNKAESPWIKQFDEMAKNLLLRRVLKNAPKSIQMQRAETEEVRSETNLDNFYKASNEQAENDFFAQSGEVNTVVIEENKEEEKKPQGKKKTVKTSDESEFFNQE